MREKEIKIKIDKETYSKIMKTRKILGSNSYTHVYYENNMRLTDGKTLCKKIRIGNSGDYSDSIELTAKVSLDDIKSINNTYKVIGAVTVNRNYFKFGDKNKNVACIDVCKFENGGLDYEMEYEFDDDKDLELFKSFMKEYDIEMVHSPSKMIRALNYTIANE